MKFAAIFGLLCALSFPAHAESPKGDRPARNGEWLNSLAKTLCESLRGRGVTKCQNAGTLEKSASISNADIYQTAISQCFPEADPVPERHSLVCLDLAKKQWGQKQDVNENIRLCREFSELGIEKKISNCIRKTLNCEANYPSLQDGIRHRAKNIENLRARKGLDKTAALKQWSTESFREVNETNAADARSCIEQTQDLLKSQPAHKQVTQWKEAADLAAEKIKTDHPALVSGLRGPVTD